MKKDGFTLVELMIVGVTLTIVMGAVCLMMWSGQKAYATGTTISVLQDKARGLVERITRDFQGTAISKLLPDPTSAGVTSVTFNRCTGYTVGSGAQWSGSISYTYNYTSGATGTLSRTENGTATVICAWIKKDCFLITRDGNLLTVQVTLLGVSSDSRSLTANATSSVRVEN